MARVKRRAGTARATAIIPDADRENRRVGKEDSGCKPMAVERIPLFRTPRSENRPWAETRNTRAQILQLIGWRGRGVFAISSACGRRRRIADSRQTPHQPKPVAISE